MVQSFPMENPTEVISPGEDAKTSFALAALTGLCAHADIANKEPAAIAERAWKIAEAMIAPPATAKNA
jgi:hypothetical protein